MEYLLEKITYLWSLMPVMLDGTKVTVALFLLTLVFALPLGLPVALGSEVKFRPVRAICRAYVFVFRGTPLMLQLFFFYFFLPIMLNIRMNVFMTSVVTFVLNYAAYLAEIYRGGINGIDKGQYEAAYALGLSKWQTMFRIILPQTFRTILPAVANEAIALIKDTALASAISLGELMKASKSAVNRDTAPEAYLLAAVIYLIFTFVVTYFFEKAEKKYASYDSKDKR